MNQLLRLAGIAAIIYFSFKALGNQIANRITIGKIKLKVASFNPTGLLVRVFLPFTNNTPVSLPITSFQGELFFGNHKLSNLGLFSPITLESGETVEPAIDLNIGFANLAQEVVSIITNGDFFNRFRIKGFFSSNGIIFPVDQTLQII